MRVRRPPTFAHCVEERAAALAQPQAVRAGLGREARSAARATRLRRPLASYRAEELERMRLNFYGFDPSYHIARHRFVHRTPHAWTPLHLAQHRQLGFAPRNAPAHA